MENQYTADIQDYVAMFRRRRRIMFWAAAFCLITALVLAFGIPAQYLSTGTIMIEQAQISDDIVRTTFPRDVDTNLSIQRITDFVITRENLSALVEAHDLYPELRENATDNEAIRELRSNIEVVALTAEDLPLGSESTETIAFEVLFFHPTPEKARDVARDLIDLYTQEHHELRTTLALTTIQFLETEAKKLEKSISETEATLAQFKQQHAGALPELINMNLQVMERTGGELQSVERDIRIEQQNKNMLTAELSQIYPSITVYTEDGRPVQGTAERLRMLEREYVRISSLYSPQHPDRIRLQKEIAQLRESGIPPMQKRALKTEITIKRNKLSQLLERYSEDHPDIVKLERLIYGLEMQLDALPTEDSLSNASKPSNPEYISVKVRLDAANREVSALISRRDELRRKLSTLESRIMLTPQVEREYRELTRDYELAVDKYNEIKNKQGLAEINLSLEIEQKGETFAVYKKPGYPLKPVRPNRPLIMIAAIALGVTLSVGLAVATETLDTTMRGRRDVQSIWDAPPIAVIPFVHNPADIASKFVHFGATAIALAVWAGGLYSSLQLLF